MTVLPSRTLRALGTLAFGVALLASASALPTRAATPTADLAPLAGGDDYASEMLGAPWDMSDVNSFAFEYTRKTGNVSGLTLNNGILEATATNGDPRVTLLLPSLPTVNAVAPEGGFAPIDASRYRYLTARIYLEQASTAHVFWQATTGTPYGASGFQSVNAGWNDVTIDLAAGGNGSSGSWSGLIQGLYLDPTMKQGPFKIDYVRLSSAPLSDPANAVPQLRITSPSFVSGPDYANTVRGDPWDMSDASDIASTAALGPLQFSNGVMTASTGNCSGGACGDPSLSLRLTSRIDTSKFKYLTYRMKIEGAQDTDLGSVSRIFWWTTIPEQASVSTDIVVFEGWRTVSFDLTKIKLETGAPWANSNPSTFRFDPHEFVEAHTFSMDYVTLTGDSVANSSFDIRYQATDADDGAPTTQLFFDADRSGFDGQPITCVAAPAPSGDFSTFLPMLTSPGVDLSIVQGSTCRWNTANVPNGTYYIYGSASDGTDTTSVYSQTPVIVQH